MRIRRLAAAANLYGGSYAGTDSTAVDGIFETLQVTNSERQTIVLVTSGNPSFAEGPRRQLLDALREIEGRLLKIGRRRAK